MQCFYAARPESGNPHGAIKIDVRLTIGRVSNYEHSNEDGHVNNFIEPADDVLTVVAVLWDACRAGAAH